MTRLATWCRLKKQSRTNTCGGGGARAWPEHRVPIHPPLIDSKNNTDVCAKRNSSFAVQLFFVGRKKFLSHFKLQFAPIRNNKAGKKFRFFQRKMTLQMDKTSVILGSLSPSITLVVLCCWFCFAFVRPVMLCFYNISGTLQGISALLQCTNPSEWSQHTESNLQIIPSREFCSHCCVIEQHFPFWSERTELKGGFADRLGGVSW